MRFSALMASIDSRCSCRADAVRILDVEHRIADGIELDALELAGQNSGRPLARGDRLHLAALARRTSSRRSRADPRSPRPAVKHPRTHAGAAGDDGPGVHEGVGRIVIDLLGPHGAHDADIVGHAADVRKQFADFLAGLAELLESVCGPKQFSSLALQLRDLLPFGEAIPASACRVISASFGL